MLDIDNDSEMLDIDNDIQVQAACRPAVGRQKCSTRPNAGLSRTRPKRSNN